MPSATDWSQPNRPPVRVGPSRSWIRADTFRSAQMKANAPPAITLSTSTAETIAAMVEASSPDSPRLVRKSTMVRHHDIAAAAPKPRIFRAGTDFVKIRTKFAVCRGFPQVAAGATARNRPRAEAATMPPGTMPVTSSRRPHPTRPSRFPLPMRPPAPPAIAVAVLLVGAVLACFAAADPGKPFVPRRQSGPPGAPLEPAEAARRMTVPPGFAVQVFAAEPDLVNPITDCP